MCEDWYHGRHLIDEGQKLPKDENYSEMICKSCFEKHISILSPYLGHTVTIIKKVEENANETNPNESLNVSTASDLNVSTVSDLSMNVSTLSDVSIPDDSKCLRVVPASQPEARSLFLMSNWRKKLCKCEECLKLYENENLTFLIDEEDTVHFYESQAKDEGSNFEKGMEALSKVDRVKQVEAIQGYNAMKSNLMEYLKKFAENGKVVRQEDIQEFFQNMQATARKRQRVEIPKFCK